MKLNSIATDRPAAPQTSHAPNGGGENFQVAYARVFDERYAPVAADAAPDRTPRGQQNPVRPANTAHTVHAGETLYGIARARLATTGAAAGAGALREGVAQLAKANNIRNPDRIYAGQKLDLAALDAAFGPNQAAATRAPAATALREVISPPGGGEDYATDFDMSPHAQWRPEDLIAADTLPMAVSQPAQLPVATLPFPPAAAFAGIANAATATMPPIDLIAARQVALYEQNAAAAPEKSAEPARALPDIVYKGIAGKVLDAMPIEPSTRATLQRANTIVSSTFTARSLGVLTGLGGPLLTVAGLLWGIFSSRQIDAAPAGDAKPAADTNPVVDAKQTAQYRVADAIN
jgi:LysM repeat protein